MYFLLLTKQTLHSLCYFNLYKPSWTQLSGQPTTNSHTTSIGHRLLLTVTFGQCKGVAVPRQVRILLFHFLYPSFRRRSQRQWAKTRSRRYGHGCQQKNQKLSSTRRQDTSTRSCSMLRQTNPAEALDNRDAYQRSNTWPNTQQSSIIWFPKFYKTRATDLILRHIKHFSPRCLEDWIIDLTDGQQLSMSTTESS